MNQRFVTDHGASASTDPTYCNAAFQAGAQEVRHLCPCLLHRETDQPRDRACVSIRDGMLRLLRLGRIPHQDILVLRARVQAST